MSSASDAVPTDPVAASGEYLAAVRQGEDTTPYRERLASIPEAALATALDGRRARTAFWVNLYNAAVQDLLGRDRSLYEADWLGRRPIYRRALVTVAGHDLSLDDVEHGMLRSSSLGIGLGYVPRLFVGDFEKRFRLDEVDPRIHFALNCGARSCPPIRNYTAEGIDEELDLATAAYFADGQRYDPETDTARVPRVMLWFRGDFGGKSGIYDFLRTHDVIPPGASPKLVYDDYDWTRDLGAYAGGT